MYVQCKEFGNHIVCVSGCGPDLNGICELKGRLGREIDIPTGQLAAKNCILNALAILNRDLNGLDRIKSVIKMLVFVNSDDSFMSQPLVANGASAFLADVFGNEKGIPTRSAIGVNVLPGNIPVEIELMIELEASS